MTNYPSLSSTYTAVNNQSYCEWSQSWQDQKPIPSNLLLHKFENQKVSDHAFQFRMTKNLQFSFFYQKH